VRAASARPVWFILVPMKKEYQMPAFDARIFISMPEKSDETRLMKELI
jgi:hypothetical protein